MNNLELARYFFALDRDEARRFADVLLDSGVKEDGLVYRLCTYYYDRLSGNRDLISRKDAFAFLYGQDAPYRPQRLRRVSMELKRHLLDFIADTHSSPIPREIEKEYAIRKFLLDKGQFDLFREREQKWSSSPEARVVHPNAHLGEVFFGRLHNEYLIHMGLPGDTWAEAIDQLDQFYYMSRLQLWSAMKNKEIIYRQPHEYAFADQVEEVLSSHAAQKWTGAQLWYLVWQLFDPARSATAFQKLSEWLVQNGPDLPIDQLRQIRGFMLNHLNWSRAEGVEKYQALWELFVTMRGEGTLYAEGRITMAMFRGAVRSACLAGETAWAREFLDSCGADLKGEEAEKQLQLFAAWIAFYEGEPEQALGLTEQIRFASVRHECYLKVVQVMAAFELGEEADLFRRAEAFRKYVARHGELGERFARRQEAFVQLVIRIGKARFHGQQVRKSLGETLEKGGMAEEFWLRRMVQRWVEG